MPRSFNPLDLTPTALLIDIQQGFRAGHIKLAATDPKFDNPTVRRWLNQCAGRIELAIGMEIERRVREALASDMRGARATARKS